MMITPYNLKSPFGVGGYLHLVVKMGEGNRMVFAEGKNGRQGILT
jgi:hypothetical protein